MDFRLYFLTAHGRIARALDYSAPGEAEAIEHAISVGDGSAMELWSGTRVITAFPTGPRPPAPATEG